MALYDHVIKHCLDIRGNFVDWMAALIRSYHVQTGALVVVAEDPAYRLLDNDGNYLYGRSITGAPIALEAAPTSVDPALEARWFKTDAELEITGYLHFTGDTGETCSLTPYYAEEDGQITHGTIVTGITHHQRLHITGIRKRRVMLVLTAPVGAATACAFRFGGCSITN